MKYGTLIHQSRKAFVDDFTPIFQKYYTQLSNNKESVALIYQSQLNEDKFEDLLVNNLAKDKTNHYTNFGIHKDDLTSPMYLFKAGIAYEEKGDYKSAFENYTKIKNDYAESSEGRTIEKYLARAEALK